MPRLSWKHQYQTLIQALLFRGPLKEEEFHTIFHGVTEEDPGTNRRQFNDVLLKINKELSYVQFELRLCRNQYDGKVYYGVVNNVADEQSKLGTKYTVPQIAFYKCIIEAIVQDAKAQGSISTIEALNIRLENQVNGMDSQSQGGVPPALKNFSMSQKEKTLNQLVTDQWLCSTQDGNIGLGPRSFLDLRSWFHTNEVPSCEFCNEAGIKAELCRNAGCTIRIHRYCLEKKLSQGKVGCPGCGTQWRQYQVPKEEAVEQTESQLPPLGATRKRNRSCKTNNADSHGSGHSQLQLPVGFTRKKPRSSKVKVEPTIINLNICLS